MLHFTIRMRSRAWLALALLLATLPATQARADESAALRTLAAQQRARQPAPRFPRIAFLAKPALAGAWLSPDGRYVAWLQDDGMSRSVWVQTTATAQPRRLLANTLATGLAWTRDSRWLLLETPTQLFALAAKGQPGSRTISRIGGLRPRSLEAIDPSQPAAALVLESPSHGPHAAQPWKLFRIDMQGRQTLLHQDARPLVDFAIDAGGRLDYVIRADGDHYTLLRRSARGWQPVLACRQLHRCAIAGHPSDGSGLLLLTDIDGDLRRLVRVDDAGRTHTLHEDPSGEADIDSVTTDPYTGQPLIAGYRSTAVANHGLTGNARAHVRNITRRYPGRDLRIEAGSGPDARWLIHERAGSLKGERLHVYDPATGRMSDIAMAAPAVGFHHERATVQPLPEAAMARQMPFSFVASDGMRIHGFVLLPPGIDPSAAPLVANVHGGPFNRVRPGFSTQSQFLANRGYVVFEPNFRGSTGYGRNYMRAGHGDFGNGRVQQDIVEGVRHLLAHGIGDARRVGIIGASFGGYAALQGVTFQPDLFKVAVAAVPPVDLGWVTRWYVRNQDEMTRGIPLAASMRMLELDPADPRVAQRLRSQSPLANASRLRRPLLLLAGGDDERVPIRSVTHYAARLRTLDKDVSLFIDAEGTHQLPSPLTREAYLYLLESMLHRRLGGAAPEPPGKALRAHLRRNMKLAGSDFPLKDSATDTAVRPRTAR